MTKNDRVPPAHVVKLSLVEAAIWRNGTPEKAYYSVTLKRYYAVERDGHTAWKGTTSFGRDDLLVASKALNEAHSWLIQNSGKQEPVRTIEESETSDLEGNA